MAPAAAADEADYFAIMGLAPGAAEADIRKAYRKLSLALHPDKNRHMDATAAAARFSEMQLAYEVLMDPAARLAAAERVKAEGARQERRGAYEGKRKAMAEELERREEDEKQKRYKAAQDERQRKQTLERLREEGRQLREQKEKEAREQRERERTSSSSSKAQSAATKGGTNNGHAHETTNDSKQSSPQPDLGPLDLTVTLRFPSDQHARLSASAGSPGSAVEDPLNSVLATALAERFGKLDSLIFKPLKNADGKARREATAHATFTTLDAAFRAVKAGSQLEAGGSGSAVALDDVWIGWAGAPKKGRADAAQSGPPAAQPGEPARISWMRQRGMFSSSGMSSSAGAQGARNGSPVESDVLHRMTSSEASNADEVHLSKPAANGNSTFPSFSFNPFTTKGSPSPQAKKEYSGHSAQNLSFADFESETLRRMREAERLRVEEAIRQADASS